MTTSITAPTETDDYPTENGAHVAETTAEPVADSFTWAEFVRAVLDADATDSVKLTLTAITAETAGKAGQPVDLDQLETDTGKKRGTVQNLLVELASMGWLEKRAKLNGNRAVTEYVTTASVNG